MRLVIWKWARSIQSWLEGRPEANEDGYIIRLDGDSDHVAVVEIQTVIP